MNVNSTLLKTLKIDEQFLQDDEAMTLLSEIIERAMKLAVKAVSYKHVQDMMNPVQSGANRPGIQYHVSFRRAPNGIRSG